MTTYTTDAITFPSAPISGDTLATVDLVGHDWLADADWQRFEDACRLAQAIYGHVDPSDVRTVLTNAGQLQIRPRRLSAFYRRATSKSGFLDFSHWGINADTKGRNAGRPARIYRIRAAK